MKKLNHLVISMVLLACTSAIAQTTKPSAESLQKLFNMTEVRSMIPKIQSQLDESTNQMIQKITEGKTLTPKQQKAVENFRRKITKIEQDELSWKAVEPRITEIYQNILSQEEVNGIIAFYETPIGRSYIKKMPAILQQSMMTMQKMLVPMMQKMEAAADELDRELEQEIQK